MTNEAAGGKPQPYERAKENKSEASSREQAGTNKK
jgi:hypothetical protein